MLSKLVGSCREHVAPAFRTPIEGSKMVLTEKGQKRGLWRAVAWIYRGMFSLTVTGLATVLVFDAAPAAAAIAPIAGIKDQRVRDIDYDPDQVVTLSGHFRHALEIEFGGNETVSQAALGDTISWQIAPVGNLIFLKPREKAQGTNLVVVTTGPSGVRTYHFQLVMGDGPYMYGVRFHYPHQEAAIAAMVANVQRAETARVIEGNVVKQALDHAVIEGERNFKYTVQGSSDLQPSEISDNGEFTVLRYPGHADIPSIFAVNNDGAEEIVAYDVRDDFVVIHAVYKRLRLRRGGQVLCIYNEGPVRNDRSVRTGTVSNVVERNIQVEQ